MLCTNCIVTEINSVARMWSTYCRTIDFINHTSWLVNVCLCPEYSANLNKLHC